MNYVDLNYILFTIPIVASVLIGVAIGKNYCKQPVAPPPPLPPDEALAKAIYEARWANGDYKWRGHMCSLEDVKVYLNAAKAARAHIAAEIAADRSKA